MFTLQVCLLKKSYNFINLLLLNLFLGILREIGNITLENLRSRFPKISKISKKTSIVEYFKHLRLPFIAAHMHKITIEDRLLFWYDSFRDIIRIEEKN
jgi:hypothetical protein